MTRLPRRRRRRPPETNLTIGLFGVLGSGNWGNDGSLDVVVDLLRKRFPDARLGFMAMGPDRLSATYDVEAVHLQWYEAHMDRLSWLPGAVLKAFGKLMDPARTLSWVRRQDVVIVPGAGVLETTTPVRPWAMPYSLLLLGLSCRISRARLAYLCVGADANRDRDGLTYRVLGRAARLAHYRSYRDELSRDVVREMGVDVRADRVYPDLAFALDAPPMREAGGRVVGVGVMNYRGAAGDRHRADELHAAYVVALKGVVRLLVDEGWAVRLFTGDAEDDEVLRLVQAAASSGGPRGSRPSVSAEVVGSLPELMDVVAGVDLVVASRFHNVLSALKVGIPTLSISYARKNDVLQASMGLGEFCHPAAEIDLDRLVAQFRDLDRRRDELVAVLAEANRENRRGVARQLDDFEAFLRG